MSRLLCNMEAAIDRMGTWDLYVDIARAFAESLPQAEADIVASVEQDSWFEARRFVHSLKSNCAAVGADALRERVYILEKACVDADAQTVARLWPPLQKELRLLREEILAL